MLKVLNKEIFYNAQIGSINITVDSAIENSAGFVEYIVTVIIEEYTHKIGRRYSDFKEFNNILKYHFPDLSFPMPSKFVLYNKVEQRKKGFNSFMSGLVQILSVISPDKKLLLLKLLAEFLEIDAKDQTKDEEKNRKTKKFGISELIKQDFNDEGLREQIEVKFDKS